MGTSATKYIVTLPISNVNSFLTVDVWTGSKSLVIQKNADEAITYTIENPFSGTPIEKFDYRLVLSANNPWTRDYGSGGDLVLTIDS